MKIVDFETWPRTPQYEFFRTFAQPHYAVTSRLDVTHLRARKGDVSSYRACLFAIGTALHSVPELLMRIRGDTVVQHDSVGLSMTVPTETGSFNYAYVPFTDDFTAFDAQAKAIIEQAGRTSELDPNIGKYDSVAYLSCLPWLDFTSINNALPGPDDCIPRVSWGKFTPEGDRVRMAMTLEVHHALVDGQQIGAYFEKAQSVLNSF